MRVAVIIPALNEAAGIAAALDALRPLRTDGTFVVVSDGGSADSTVALATPRCDAVVAGPSGRARQMNAGARRASDADAFLFLHADTMLPPGAIAAVIDALRAGRHAWGHFDITIAGRSRWLPVVAALMNVRSRLSGIATGDQALFVTREAFDTCGGFPEWPLMEDIGICRALKRLSPPAALRLKVTTAGRRWDAHGPLSTIAFMWWLRLRFFCGADPARLARSYAAVR